LAWPDRAALLVIAAYTVVLIVLAARLSPDRFEYVFSEEGPFEEGAILLWLADGAGALRYLGLPNTIGDGLRFAADWIGPPMIYLNNRGMVLPEPALHAGASVVGIALIAAIVATIALRIWARRRQTATGRPFPMLAVGIALIVGLPMLAAFVAGSPFAFERPVLRGFNFSSGIRLIPELVALLIALSTYTAAFIAEIVRAGIEAVAKGRTQAAQALGLSRA